jgi:hypothetical protein
MLPTEDLFVYVYVTIPPRPGPARAAPACGDAELLRGDPAGLGTGHRVSLHVVGSATTESSALPLADARVRPQGFAHPGRGHPC